MNPIRLDPLPHPRPDRGFVRHDLYILAAAVLLLVAVVIPQALRYGFQGALLATLGALGGLVLLAGLLLLATWVIEQAGNPGPGWWGLAFRGAGHGGRFALFGVMAAVLGISLVHGHGLSAAGEDLASLASGALGGAVGCWLRHHLGPARFWPAFGRFCLALLASFIGGILGILGPGTWWVDLGILIPLLMFAILAATGRIVPHASSVSPPST